MTQTLVREPANAPESAAPLKPAKRASEQGHAPLTIRFEPVIEMTGELFEQFCAMNDDMRIELTAEGTIEIMPPLKGDAGAKEADIVIDLGNWTRANRNGRVFGPNGTFALPNGAIRMPDASWISSARYDRLTAEEKNDYTPLCPDFVVELRSVSDRLSIVQAKMEEYMANGARLGWLLDPFQQRAYVYRPGAAVEILDNPETLSGDPELPGFMLDLARIWEPAG